MVYSLMMESRGLVGIGQRLKGVKLRMAGEY
jgi:hypothetical protein